jgi:transglutaminase-like putative cysteine protease
MLETNEQGNGRLVAALSIVCGLMLAGAGGCDDGGSEKTESNSAGAEETTDEASAENESADADASEAQGNSQKQAAGSDKTSIPGGTDARTFEFTYQATVKPGDAEGDVDIFLPVATDTDHQTILERTVDSPVEGEIREEETYGNSFWHASLDELPEEPMTIEMTYRVEREVFERSNLEEEKLTQFEPNERDEFELYLKPNERVPTSGELIEKVAADIGFEQYDSPLQEARAIYNHVVDTMEYKKTGDGWGNGDTYWACNEEYGNCTDFHALFTSLARYRDIPSRFEIGFPVPTDRKSGEIGGYHCWLDFYLPGIGWTPIDASEAKKNPELREMYFGTHPADRIQFSVGRDLKLGDGHDSEPLNFFIYPMVEVGGERYDGVDTRFSYEEKTS